MTDPPTCVTKCFIFALFSSVNPSRTDPSEWLVTANFRKQRGMPAVTDITKSMPELCHHRIYGPPEYYIFSRLYLLISTATILSVIILFARRIARSCKAAQSVELQLTATNKNITWTSKPSSARWISIRHPTYRHTLGSLVPPRQGQGLFENQAKDARISIEKVVYEGSPTGIAPVGLGGAGEGSGRMMSGLPEGEKTASSTPASTSGSRGVSTNLSSATFAQSSAPGVQPLSLIGSAPRFPAADEHSRGHVGISRGPSPSSFILAGGSSGGEDAEIAAETGESMEAHMPTMTYSPFGHHMTDDEHVSYTTSEYRRSGSPVREDPSAYRRNELYFSRPPPPAPLVPPTLASRSLYSLYGTHQAEDEYAVPLQHTSYYGASVPMRTDNTIAGRPIGQESYHEYVPVANSSKTRGASGRGNNKPASTTNNKAPRSKGSSKKKSHTTTKSMPIPSNFTAASGSHSKRRKTEDMDRQEFFGPSDNNLLTSSSYPSTSPLLPPPPPPNSEYYPPPPFDPAEVMFPGGFVADGGIRMVPTYLDDDEDYSPLHDDDDEDVIIDRDSEQREDDNPYPRGHYDDHHYHHGHDNATGGPSSVGEDVVAYGEIRNGSSGAAAHHAEEEESSSSGRGGGWRRHTRVYGGGICLACATVGGRGGVGGYYGARVRPEDKRR